MIIRHKLLRGSTLKLIGAGLAGTLLAGCTTAELEAISAGLSQGLAEASYNAPYGSSYAPYGGSSYGSSYGSSGYGQWVGYGGCNYVGSFYTCDTNNDGYADMFGDTDDGSYTSSSLKVNGRGEAFTWGENGWERNRAYDGPRQPDEIIIYDGDDD